MNNISNDLTIVITFKSELYNSVYIDPKNYPKNIKIIVLLPIYAKHFDLKFKDGIQILRLSNSRERSIELCYDLIETEYVLFCDNDIFSFENNYNWIVELYKYIKKNPDYTLVQPTILENIVKNNVYKLHAQWGSYVVDENNNVKSYFIGRGFNKHNLTNQNQLAWIEDHVYMLRKIKHINMFKNNNWSHLNDWSHLSFIFNFYGLKYKTIDESIVVYNKFTSNQGLVISEEGASLDRINIKNFNLHNNDNGKLINFINLCFYWNNKNMYNSLFHFERQWNLHTMMMMPNLELLNLFLCKNKKFTNNYINNKFINISLFIGFCLIFGYDTIIVNENELDINNEQFLNYISDIKDNTNITLENREYNYTKSNVKSQFSNFINSDAEKKIRTLSQNTLEPGISNKNIKIKPDEIDKFSSKKYNKFYYNYKILNNNNNNNNNNINSFYNTLIFDKKINGISKSFILKFFKVNKLEFKPQSLTINSSIITKFIGNIVLSCNCGKKNMHYITSSC